MKKSNDFAISIAKAEAELTALENKLYELKKDAELAFKEELTDLVTRFAISPMKLQELARELGCELAGR